MVEFSFTEEDLEEAGGDESSAENQNIPPSILAEDADIEGALVVKHGLEIAGRFKGDLYSNSKIKVMPTGSVQGQMEAFDIVIQGKTNVSMTARKRLEILKGGAFVGHLEIQPEVIRLSEFAKFGQDDESAEAFHKEFTRDRSVRIAQQKQNETSVTETPLPEEERPHEQGSES